jgi:hypothetical protein
MPWGQNRIRYRKVISQFCCIWKFRREKAIQKRLLEKARHQVTAFMEAWLFSSVSLNSSILCLNHM